MKIGLDHQAAVDQLAQSISAKITLGSAVTGFLGWLAQINWLGLIASCCAIVGLAANVYFQIRRDRREQRESEARIKALKNHGCIHDSY